MQQRTAPELNSDTLAFSNGGGEEGLVKKDPDLGRSPCSLVSQNYNSPGNHRQLCTTGQVTAQLLLNGGKGPPVRSH